eukprot:1334985-Rhodomonas_salina.1
MSLRACYAKSGTDLAYGAGPRRAYERRCAAGGRCEIKCFSASSSLPWTRGKSSLATSLRFSQLRYLPTGLQRAVRYWHSVQLYLHTTILRQFSY